MWKNPKFKTIRRLGVYVIALLALVFSTILGIPNGPLTARAGGNVNTIGVFRQSNGTFFLRLQNSTGFSDISVNFDTASQPYAVVGDWTGNGYDAIGVYDQTLAAIFALCMANDAYTCAALQNTIHFEFSGGAANDIPVSGRWTTYLLTA